MQKKINTTVKAYAIEQQEMLKGKLDNSHVVIGICFISLLAGLNLFLII